MNDDTIFQVNAPGVDVERIVAEIRETVAEKMERGDYTDARVGRADRTNLINLKNEDEFLSFYLECLRDAVFVDISDFEIIEKRARLSRLLVTLKRTIWKLLKFYTYRLWSQQNQVNGLLLSAVEGTDERYRTKLEKLEARISELEKRQSPQDDA
jgi:hypothetical protein